MTSDPTQGSVFLGRETIIATLRKRIDSFARGYRQNLAIIAPARSGKTSLLHHILSTEKNFRLLPIYLDLSASRTEDIVDHWIRKMIFGFISRDASVPGNEDAQALLARIQVLLPHTYRHIRETLLNSSGKFDDALLSAMLESASIFCEETGIRCLVILDEFHLLGGKDLKKPFQTLGKCIMVQKNVMYVIASSNVTEAQSILNHKLSLLFGRFETLELGPFSFDEAKACMQQSLDPVAVPQELMHYLVQWTGGHPYYLDLVCRELKHLLERDLHPKLSPKTLLECLRRLLLDHQGVLNQTFVGQTTELRRIIKDCDAGALLVRIAGGIHQRKHLAAALRIAERNLSEALAVLCEKGVLKKYGAFFVFSDPVYAFWFKHVYHLKKHLQIGDKNYESREFVRSCEECMNEFFVVSSQTIPDRTRDLLSRFSNEIVEMESKRRKLPRFTSMEIMDLKTSIPEVTVFNAKGGQSRWICVLNCGRMTEEKFRQLMSALKPFSKEAKIMLLTLSKFDSNVSVLAKAKTLWVIHLQDINMLMELFNRPKIIDFSPEERQPLPALVS